MKISKIYIGRNLNQLGQHSSLGYDDCKEWRKLGRCWLLDEENRIDPLNRKYSYFEQTRAQCFNCETKIPNAGDSGKLLLKHGKCTFACDATSSCGQAPHVTCHVFIVIVFAIRFKINDTSHWPVVIRLKGVIRHVHRLLQTVIKVPITFFASIRTRLLLRPGGIEEIHKWHLYTYL